MRVTRFFNSIHQISSAEHINTINGSFRHIRWLFRRATNGFPVKLKLSNSLVLAKQSSGVYALVNSMGIYDYNNMHLIKLLLNRLPGSVFVDVGANVGAYSVVASEVNEATVVSIEPHPATYKELKTNIELNKRKNVIMLNLAASNLNGVVKFTDFCSSDSSLNRVLKADKILPNVVNVKSQTLDKICESIKVAPDIIKIDVEGHEAEVLAGLQKFMCNVKLFLIENGKRKILSRHLCKNNFEGPLFYYHSKKAFKPISQRRAEDSIFIHNNLINDLTKWGLNIL